MKKLYFLFFLTIGFLSNAQIINFPDAKFKAKLLSASSSNTIASTNSPIYNSVSNSWSAPNYQKIDINNDGEIEVSEALQVKYLDISNTTSLPASFQISSVSGIEEFTNLEALKCVSNQVSSINVLGLTNLKLLDFYYNRLTEFNIQGLTNLRQIHCGRNQITSLNVQGLINLTQIRCFQNQITSLNVEGLINLKELSCASNQITSINLQNLNSLNSLYCESNLLSTLDLSNAPNLLILNCQNNLLTSLFIKNGKTEVLNFSNNISLQYICCDEIQDQDIENAVITNGQNCNVNSYCSFVPGGVYYEIVGSTKFDFNNNGCDISDIDYSNLNLIISNGTNSGGFIASTFGSYLIPVQAGIHTITPNLENPTYFNISPTSFTANFPTQTSPFTQDFCVTANGVKHDVEVVLIPTVPARPGFDANYKLVYRNKGNQIESGSISLTFDDAKLDYVSSNPVFNSTAVNNLTWNYTNLQPFETREITLVLNVNSQMEIPAVNIGDQINFLAEITPFTNDEIQYDNISALKQIVVGSYDPNDKTCLQGTTITPTEVGNYVHYVIRFENTGTYPAENIVVKDMIDLVKFDIATLVPLKSSHEFYTRINENKVEFIFENINLDFNDATNDGYVVFKIKTKPTLVVGNTFTNNANIYFDYNFPITTNTYTTTVAALNNQDFDFGTYFTLYPNPAKDVLNIQAKQGLAINSIEIYNQLGQIVMATNAVNTVDVANLASGTYFVKINTEKGSANVKFVKE
ncbi:DUF7619 domain-containing protein [Flavobacterium sp. UBA7663]|uniref:T9SS type A sorting domain-containing protein n=1 Tax=Flavobacterium sp. UBA7663 TaxID=1946557 RepID=UPI0025C0A575|nr:T9SS type A sorting domain-containing protein [Flavobacterium sp. UBA7663]